MSLKSPARIDALGVSPQRVAQAVRFTFRGQRLRRYQGPHGEIDMVLGLSERVQPGLDSLTEIPLPTEDGETITLGAVAEMQVARTPPRLRRVDRQTTSWVTAEFDREEVTTQQGKEAVGEALAGLAFPTGYSWDWGIDMRRQNDGLMVMLFGVLMSLAVVVFLMAALFESITQPLAILITLPLALFGGEKPLFGLHHDGRRWWRRRGWCPPFKMDRLIGRQIFCQIIAITREANAEPGVEQRVVRLALAEHRADPADSQLEQPGGAFRGAGLGQHATALEPQRGERHDHDHQHFATEIWSAEDSTWSDDALRSAIICRRLPAVSLKVLPKTSASERGTTSTERSPLAIESAIPAISFR